MKKLKDILDRAGSTAAQAALAAIGGDVANIWSVDWKAVLGLAASAALLSVLQSFARKREG